jgi:hypothetical protein
MTNVSTPNIYYPYILEIAGRVAYAVLGAAIALAIVKLTQ